MSIRIMTQVWDNAKSGGTELLLLLALADHANDDGVCWPRVGRLAEKARLSVRQTQRLLVNLEENGYIIRDTVGGRGKNSIYTFQPQSAWKKGDIQGEPELVSDKGCHPGYEKGDIPTHARDLTVIEPSCSDTNVSASVPEQPAQPTLFEPEIPPRTTGADDVIAANKTARRSRKKKAEAYVNEETGVATQDIAIEYVKCVEEYEPGASISFGRVGKAAKALAEKGWTPQSVRDCFAGMKRDEFWRDKHLPLQSIAEVIGAKIGAPQKKATREPRTIRIIDPVTGEIREVQA